MEFSFADLALRLVGAFYAFAGIVATRAALMGNLMDAALAGITLEPTSKAERRRTGWLLVASLIILAGGVALALLTDLTPWLFGLSAALQALYLGVLAPAYFDKAEAPDARGRQQSKNAFVIYLAATAFVFWASASGRLKAWRTLPPELLSIVLAALIAYAGYALWTFARPFPPRNK